MFHSSPFPAPVGKIELRPYQEDAINSIFEYFKVKSGNPVLALPTGTGKSIIIAKFIERVLKQWPGQRILGLTHVKELVAQNAAKIKEAWPLGPLGIYSAGLKKKDIAHPIIFGGVASVANSEDILNAHWDLIIIDEAHLISPKADTRYQKIMARVRAVNPNAKVIGLSATPFRMGQGVITDGGLFTDVCFDLTKMSDFTNLIAGGYMSPLVAKRTDTLIDLSGVKLVAGEFNEKQLQEATDKDEITVAAVREMIQYGRDRKAWLIFAAGVEHAKHIAAMLTIHGISAKAVYSGMGDVERDEAIAAFKSGQIRAITNNNILTTGFDHPPIDLMGVLRGTMSTSLWVQMLGRGTRPSFGKENCLVLDFARNTVRLGPINDPVLPRRKSDSKGEAPVRVCDVCGCYNHARATVCVYCGNEFVFNKKLDKTASELELIRSELPVVKYFDVVYMRYERHQRGDKLPSIKVTYNCGMQQFVEYVCLEHEGYARTLARAWWRKFHWSEPPETIEEALTRVKDFRSPKRIGVWINRQFPQIMSHEH